MNVIAVMNEDMGLCNRLKCVVNALEVAEKLGSKLSIDWQPSYSCGIEYGDLFDYGPSHANLDDSIQVSTWKLPYNCDFKFNNIKTDVRNKILKYIHKVKTRIRYNYIKEAEDYIEAWSEFVSFKDIVGLHIRRNEFILSHDKKQSTDTQFFDKIDAIIKKNPDTKFYLATDSKHTEDIFKKRYKDKIYTFYKTCLDRSKPQAIKEAMIELLILSKFKTLIVSGLSTYSEMAWWFGDCKANVEVMGKKEPAKQTTESKTSFASWINQTLRRKSAVYRWIMRRFRYWA